jgi:hypothetical protein
VGVVESQLKVRERIENPKEKKDISTDIRGKVEITSCNRDIKCFIFIF